MPGPGSQPERLLSVLEAGGLSRRREENERLLVRIREIWGSRRRVYGSPRITAELRSEGHRYGKNRIARLMSENGIRSLVRRRYKVTTKREDRLPVAEDLVKRDFTAASANRLWVSDITHIWTWEGWLYLAAVMDVHNREIVGWTLRERPTKDLVVDALLNGLQTGRPEAGLIFHSDRGAQYASLEVRNVLRNWHVRQSMSGQGSCFDNSPGSAGDLRIRRDLLQPAAAALVVESESPGGVLS